MEPAKWLHMSLTAIFCRLRKWLGYYFEHLWARIIWKSVIIQASFRFGLAIVPVLMSQAWCQPLTVRCFGPSRLSLVVTGKVSVNSVNSYSDSCSFLFCHDHGAAVKKNRASDLKVQLHPYHHPLFAVAHSARPVEVARARLCQCPPERIPRAASSLDEARVAPWKQWMMGVHHWHHPTTWDILGSHAW